MNLLTATMLAKVMLTLNQAICLKMIKEWLKSLCACPLVLLRQMVWF